jgi:DnaJ-class molecular chaperone
MNDTCYNCDGKGQTKLADFMEYKTCSYCYGTGVSEARICACVNACQGIPTEELEKVTVIELLEHQERTMHRAEANAKAEKALADRLGEALKLAPDYLLEALNSVLDDARPRYERQREIIRGDIEAITKTLTEWKTLRGEG